MRTHRTKHMAFVLYEIEQRRGYDREDPIRVYESDTWAAMVEARLDRRRRAYLDRHPNADPPHYEVRELPLRKLAPTGRMLVAHWRGRVGA